MEGESSSEPTQPTQAQMSEMWREMYGDMVPERILDTKIGPDGRRYYKVQWAATTMERGNNFLEAELLIKKYWDPIQKKIVLPSMRENTVNENADGASPSTTNTDENIDGASRLMQCSDKDRQDKEATDKTSGTLLSDEKQTSDIIESVAADITDERSEPFNTVSKSDNSDNTTGNVDECPQTIEELHADEQKNKRKHSDDNVISSEKCIEGESKIATKRTKDDSGDYVEDPK